MAALVRMPRAAWRRQPSILTGINRNNPLTAGMVFLHTPAFGNIELTTRKIGTSVAETVVIQSAGIGTTRTATVNAGLDFGTWQPIPANSLNYTIASYTSVASAAVRSPLFAQEYGITPWPQSMFSANLSTTSIVTAGD